MPRKFGSQNAATVSVLEPRELAVPESISARTLADMDRAVSNFKRGDVSPAIDLSDF